MPLEFMITKVFKNSKIAWLIVFGLLLIYNLYYFVLSLEMIFLTKVCLNLLLVIVFIIQAEAKSEDRTFKSIFVTMVPVMAPLVMSSHGQIIVDYKISMSLIVLGVTLSALSIAELWDSFAVLPSLRELKFGGPYRIVRHPIYFGYFISSLGILLAAFSITNLCIFLVFISFTIYRVNLEENILMIDMKYKQYMKKVRYKVVPCIY